MSVELLLLLLPAVVLFAALLLGRYPGERAIARARRAATTGRQPCVSAPLRRPSLSFLPRGGRLVGSAIAARPPPACG